MSVSIATGASFPSRSPRERLLGVAGWVAAAVLACVVVAGVTGFAYQTAASWRDLRRFPALGRMVDVGGYRLHIVCVGEGDPTVVFDGPVGSSWLGWNQVQPEVARTARVCAYDRAGYGWSDPGPSPRDSGRVAGELHALLHHAGVDPPYVLVGSSIGGLNARLFAARYGTEVAGMVLVDSAHEDQLARLPVSTMPSTGDVLALDLLRLSAHVGVPRLLDMPIGEASAGTLPAALRPMARAAGLRSAWFEAVFREIAALDRSFALARTVIPRNAPLLGDKPLVVLTRDPSAATRAVDVQAVQAWTVLQRNLAANSTNSRYVIVRHSGPLIQVDQPRVVVEAIRTVVDAVRLARRQGTRAGTRYPGSAGNLPVPDS